MTWASRRVPREGIFGADREERGGNHLAAGGHAASRRACQPCTDFRRATFLASKIVGCSVGTPTHEILSEVLRFCAAFDANGKPREGGGCLGGRRLATGAQTVVGSLQALLGSQRRGAALQAPAVQQLADQQGAARGGLKEVAGDAHLDAQRLVYALVL